MVSQLEEKVLFERVNKLEVWSFVEKHSSSLGQPDRLLKIAIDFGIVIFDLFVNKMKIVELCEQSFFQNNWVGSRS